jgi:hypothetical protein
MGRPKALAVVVRGGVTGFTEAATTLVATVVAAL